MILKIPIKSAVFEDKKTGVRTVALRFVFSDYTEGIISITRLKRSPWNPIDDIKSITINFKNDENSTSN